MGKIINKVYKKNLQIHPKDNKKLIKKLTN